MRSNTGLVWIGSQQRHSRAKPCRHDAIGMEYDHATCPVPTSAMPPQRPRQSWQFSVSGQNREIVQTLLECTVRAVPRVTPHLAIRFFWLFIRWSKQRALMLARESLPVQIICTRQTRFARTFATPVLVHNDPSQLWSIRWYPQCEMDAETQLSIFRGWLIPYAVIRCIRCWVHIIGR